MVDNERTRMPHIRVSNTAIPHDYTRPNSGGGSPDTPLPPRKRLQHANKLLGQLSKIEEIEKSRIDFQQTEGLNHKNGIYLTFNSAPNFELSYESLDFQPSGIELCSVTDFGGIAQATVFVPEGKLKYFINRIKKYRDTDTPNEKPRNQALVESISEISLAAIEALWTDEPELLPDENQKIWWELWLRRCPEIIFQKYLKELKEVDGIELAGEIIQFVDRTILLVKATRSQLALSLDTLGAIAELRKAKVAADFFTDMDRVEQREWTNDMVSRLSSVSPDAPYICILDTGVNSQHPLLKSVADLSDMHSYEPSWGTDDRFGHGTAMAGVAMFGDLTETLASSDQVEITHRLESVKITPNPALHKDPRLFGAITRESISRVEVDSSKKRSFLLAVTSTDSRDRGRPSSWSAMIDAVSSGYEEDDIKRLIIISAGNTDDLQRHLSPHSNMTDGIHDPGQSWNAITVGAYTEKTDVDNSQYPGWMAIAKHGDISPASCTSVAWSESAWPIKPDIVLEGGNMGRNPTTGEADYIDEGLQLLSTGHQFVLGKQLVSFGDTSAAATLAARLVAKLQALYPSFWPETLRALLIHSAEWSDAMKDQFAPLRIQRDYRRLLRYCGYGIPNMEKLMWSANNALTLVAQDSILPFYKDESKIKTKHINIHSIPWPTEVLQSLGETVVEMRITLSYFIEPSPGERGYANKFRYASHGLRFEAKRPLESFSAFEKRINDQAREERYDQQASADSGRWVLGENLRNIGSVHRDTWIGTAAELSERGHIAIYPVTGWWKERAKLGHWKKRARYALVISIKTPNVETDIYTPIINQIDNLVNV